MISLSDREKVFLFGFKEGVQSATRPKIKRDPRWSTELHREYDDGFNAGIAISSLVPNNIQGKP